jgi:hypothetical protein
MVSGTFLNDGRVFVPVDGIVVIAYGQTGNTVAGHIVQALVGVELQGKAVKSSARTSAVMLEYAVEMFHLAVEPLIVLFGWCEFVFPCNVPRQLVIRGSSLVDESDVLIQPEAAYAVHKFIMVAE